MPQAWVPESTQRSPFPWRHGLLVCGALVFFGPLKAQDQRGLEELRVRAESAYEQGRLLDALADYERLVSLFPEEGCLHGRLAGCALREPGRLALARRHLRIAVKLGCGDVDLEFHRARLAQLEYDFDRARDLYAAYLVAVGKKGRFKEAAEEGAKMCSAAVWDPAEAIGLEVLDRFPADPDGAFRFYRPETPGLRLVSTPKALRSKADDKVSPGRIAFHNGDTVLVYASLGKSGKTGWDLYLMSLTGGEYGEAERLSDSINTGYDERGAYLSRDGVLYFSSNRPGGLGGYDIYAVKWGAAGPVGRPERLPFPINSVNDDEFFIPEPDGGAWLSSNRAARQGRIHAYRVALSDALVDLGSISWLADEVATEGMTLRVYANGQEIGVRRLDGEGPEHEPLPALEGAVGVRIVLEDEQGDIVYETFGDQGAAWELRKQDLGWTMVERSDVDWALLADLREESSGGGRHAGQDETAVSSSTTEAGAVEESVAVRQWGQWVSSRLDSTVPDASTGVAEPVVVLTTTGGDDTPTGSLPTLDLDSSPESPETAETEPISGFASEEPQSVADGVEEQDNAEEEGSREGVALSGLDEESEDGVGVAKQDLAVNTSEPRSVSVVVSEGGSPTDEELQRMVERETGALTEVWNDMSARLLAEESEFLDNPTMSGAGSLSGLVEDLSAWSPDVGLMDPGVRDGVALEEVRQMIEIWTRAVQSATKASLAEVAGDAALAYRRERLAMREIQEMEGSTLSVAIKGLSDWQAALGGAETSGGPGGQESDQEVASWISQWTLGLDEADRGWTRKQRSGWRGDWLKRQRHHLDIIEREWELHLAELEEKAAAIAVGGVSEEGDSSGEGVPMDMDFLEVPFGRNSSETLARFVLGGPLEVQSVEESVPARLVDADVTELMAEWEAAILGSRQVERSWERLVQRNDGRGIPLVHHIGEFEALDSDMAEDLLDLKQAMLELLAESVQGRRSEHEGAAGFWEDVASMAQETDSPFLMEAESLGRELGEARQQTEFWAREVRDAGGVDRFNAQRSWHEALLAEVRLRSSMDELRAEVEGEMQRLETELIEVERLEAAAAEETVLTNRVSEFDEVAASEVLVEGMPVDWTLERGIEVLDSAVARMESEQDDGRILRWTSEEEALILSWKAWRQASAEAAGGVNSRRNTNARDKDLFFAKRNLRAAMVEVDLEELERRLSGADDVAQAPLESSGPAADGSTREAVGLSQEEAEGIEEVGVPGREEVESVLPDVVVGRSDGSMEEVVARVYGVTLPEAEVVGEGTRRNSGIRLRPIQREALERAILGSRKEDVAMAESAEEVFARSDGSPRRVGVEYKIQVGAFRKALPVALFSVFDPMWAQRLDNGITRYLAGSFDAYDPAVEARDAIRELGYSDAFVVRFVGGERVRAARPEAELLASERSAASTEVDSAKPVSGDAGPAVSDSVTGGVGVDAESTETSIPVVAEDIPTWEGVQGRVYSVQVGAFRGVPDARSLEVLGALTREDAGADGWLRLFSGRFQSESDAVEHKDELRRKGRADAFVVVYTNGLRTTLSQAGTTVTAGPSDAGGEGRTTEDPTVGPTEVDEVHPMGWRVELGRFNSTIPVRLANAILDAPLDWEIRSERKGSETVYLTRATASEVEAREWLEELRQRGFGSARVLIEEN